MAVAGPPPGQFVHSATQKLARLSLPAVMAGKILHFCALKPFWTMFLPSPEGKWCDVGILQLESRYCNDLSSKGAFIRPGSSTNAQIISISHAEPGKVEPKVLWPWSKNARSTRPP